MGKRGPFPFDVIVLLKYLFLGKKKKEKIGFIPVPRRGDFTLQFHIWHGLAYFLAQTQGLMRLKRVLQPP